MLIMPGKPARMSVDIDIICPPGTDIAPYLIDYAKYGFSSIEQVERKNAVGVNIPKEHAKLRYQMTFPQGQDDTLYILLDVLYSECHYQQVDEVPVRLDLWESEGEDVMVKVPSVADMLADKLTAFAPNTTGIPYQKKGRDSSAEVVKQLYDIGRLFDVTNNLVHVSKVFPSVCREELRYRSSGISLADVFADIRQTAMCLALREHGDKTTYKILSRGVKNFKGFLFDKTSYNEPKAAVDAAKAAYLATAIEYGESNLRKFSGPGSVRQQRVVFAPGLSPKLYFLRKAQPEAYFYWCLISDLMERGA